MVKSFFRILSIIFNINLYFYIYITIKVQMLDYTILHNKRNASVPNPLINGDEVILKDLLTETFNRNFQVYGEPLVVDEYYIARPDLISLAVYGTDEYADIICKVNGISNPFELNKDDILIIPSLDFVKESTRLDYLKDDSLVKSSSNIEKEKKSYQKTKYEKRKPNEQLVGESNYIIDKSLGLVFY